MNSRHKTVTRTFRIDREWDNILRLEAERQGVSVNVLANKILRRHALFGRWADQYRALTLTPRTFRAVVNMATQESLAKAGRESGKDIIDILDEMGLALNFDSFVYFVKELLGGPDFARWFRLSHHPQGNEDHFHLQHELGYGWSVYLSEYLLSYLRSLNNVIPEVKVYEYAVNLKVKRAR